MKNYISTTQYVWAEIIPVYLTEEEKDILKSTDNSLQPQKKIIIAKLAAERSIPVSPEVAEELNAIYNDIKPAESADLSKYTFVSMSACYRNGGYTGILNYRIKLEQKQIRF